VSAPHWIVLSYGACVLLAGGAVGLSAALARSTWLVTRVRGYERRMDRALHYLQSTITARRVWHAQLALIAVLLLLAAAARSAWPLVLTAGAAAGPPWWIERAAQRRTGRIEAQLDAWLLALSNALRANPALSSAIAASAELVAAPLSSELARVAGEQRVGVTVDHALRHMAERVGSPAVTATLAILRIARGTGGDLSHTLEAAAASLREMARLEGVVRSKTAEGRAQTGVIAGAPLLLVALLHELDPQFLAPLWTTQVGHLVVAGAIALWCAAIVLARKIVAVDV
jgi:tight adherence protein B